MTQIAPLATATLCGRCSTGIVLTTSFLRGSILATERSPAFATQTAPSPTATATGLSPTEIALITEFVCGAMRETEATSAD